MSTIDRDCKCYGLGKIKKLPDRNKFKMLLCLNFSPRLYKKVSRCLLKVPIPRIVINFNIKLFTYCGNRIV